ncbi:C39 family peptidase [Nostoc sp. C110]|uniref:C39 family peptidase n=1 Tax=Nostoc sp. C110 TaxID=3349876 RepID=UPI00370D7D14
MNNYQYSNKLIINLSKQEHPTWCWAACAEMVTRYYSLETNQVSFVTWLYNLYEWLNKLVGHNNDDFNYVIRKILKTIFFPLIAKKIGLIDSTTRNFVRSQNSSSNLNIETLSLYCQTEDISVVYNNWGITSKYTPNFINLYTIKEEINSKRPVQVCFELNKGDLNYGHVLLVSGYIEKNGRTYILLVDPKDGKERLLNFDDLLGLKNEYGKWQHTWLELQKLC